MPIRYFSEQDVQRLATMPMAIEAVREALVAMANGEAHNVPRVRARGRGIVLHGMLAAADHLQLAGWKQYATTRQGAHFVVGLHEYESGQLIALFQANRLGQLRTGAVTGIAVDVIAPQSVTRMGILGTGWQAQSQLEAVAAVRPIRDVVCYSRNAERRQRFAQQMAERLNIAVTPADEPEQAVRGMPLVVTATSSADPVLRGQWLDDGALVCAIGSNWWHKAELDVETIRRASLVVCDSVACCKHEAGDFREALEQGVFDWSQAVELADLVAGRRRVTSDDRRGVAIFKSVGMAIEDVALAARILRHAGGEAAGRTLEL